jgi:hypothetical protein
MSRYEYVTKPHNVGIRSRAAVVGRLMVRPVYPQLRGCSERPGTRRYRLSGLRGPTSESEPLREGDRHPDLIDRTIWDVPFKLRVLTARKYCTMGIGSPQVILFRRRKSARKR